MSRGLAHGKGPQRFHLERAVPVGILFEDTRHQIGDVLRPFFQGGDPRQMPERT
jgi:hypothetical protein